MHEATLNRITNKHLKQVAISTTQRSNHEMAKTGKNCDEAPEITAPSGQLLKWVGNKQRFAKKIVSFFPNQFGNYYEPFLGSGAIIATLSRQNAFGSDSFLPLIEIFKTLSRNPEKLKKWYADRINAIRTDQKNKPSIYGEVRSSYNDSPNAADLLFLSRTCYGGIVRFRKSDGHMSTPCGPHMPMPPAKFNARVDEWHRRLSNTQFDHLDYRESMKRAKKGDLIYCDPPYVYSQSIIYGAQDFRLSELFEAVEKCKSKGVRVAVSIDGSKKSGAEKLSLSVPEGLFEREVFINNGLCMLRRFQMEGDTLEGFNVSERLLLSYKP